MNQKKGKRPIPQVKPSAQVKPTVPDPPTTEKLLAGKSLYIFLGVAALIVLIVFHNFITFNNLYLFKDIGSDTMTWYWPHYVQISGYIHSLGIPKWAFNQGMGQNVYAFAIGDPFTLILCLLPQNVIPYAIVYMEICKIMGGGLIFYFYLRMLNTSRLSSIVGGLLYSFGGYMILGSGWYITSTEVFYAAIVLYSVEKFLSKGVWYWLPVAFCLLGMLQPFYVYTYALLVTVYCITRNVITNLGWKDIAINLFKIGGLALFGLLLGAFVIFSDIFQLVDNPRVLGGASLINQLKAAPIFTITPQYLNSIAGFRLFSNDLLGTGSNFKAINNFNYLEAPILYIGLVSLLLAPQAFLFFNKRKRIIYGIVVAACAAPLVFAYFRYAFWLFAVDYYRSYTFFLSLMLLFFALKALTSIDKTFVVHTKTLIATLLVLLYLLYRNFTVNGTNLVDHHLRQNITFFLLIDTVCIYLLSNKKLKLYALSVLGISIFIELASFSNITVNNRKILSNAELHQRTGYNDSTVEALALVNSVDKNFFRVTKDYGSNATDYVCLNDPLIQNYNGTTEYVEWTQSNYVRFLSELHVPNTYDPTYAKWLYGLQGRFILNTICNIKYAFSKSGGRYYQSVGYEPIKTYGNVMALKNHFYLPFGFSYNKYISLSDFRKIRTDGEKDIMLLSSVVVDDTDLVAFKGMQQKEPKDTFALTSDSYTKCETDLKQDTLAITHFDQNDIQGTIKPNEKKLLYFSIPFDKGWFAKIDGQSAKTYRVNVGFTGVLLDKGAHTVELYYKVPYLAAGAYTSLAALLIYLFAFVKYRKSKF
ncbi:MAG TPA: YfhO family protein [Bacteroidia bacterium]|nr:YfhO family protein [Bacteroidia bacterium]